jgi:hypothetical protein
MAFIQAPHEISTVLQSDLMRKSPVPIAPFLIGAAFLGANGAAWGWYNLSPKQFPVSYRFMPRHEVQGWRFLPEPISAQAQEILATTNLFSGTYSNARGDRVTVFLGTWDANNPKQMSVVGHTPDVCWVGAGWEPVAGGHPDKLHVAFGTISIPFEARTFLTPDKHSRELTAWCTLVSGQLFEEEKRFELPDNAKKASPMERQGPAARHTLKSKLTKVISQRIPGNGSKQFVRFSTSSKGSPSASFDLMADFGTRWLELQATTPSP